MDSSKNKIPLTHSRGSSVCDYCGKTMNRHNLKRHTVEHHKGVLLNKLLIDWSLLNECGLNVYLGLVPGEAFGQATRLAPKSEIGS